MLEDRIDLAKFTSAARELQNCIVMPYGGFVRRNGTVYMGACKDSGNAVALVPFIYSTTTRYILELGDGYMRFWNGGVGDQIMSGSAVYEISTPWSASQLFELHYAQDDDLMYFCHPDVARQKLTRLTASTFDLSAVVDEIPPLLEENKTTKTIAVSNAAIGTGRTATASAATFEAGHVGSYFQLRHARDANYVELDLTATATSTAMVVEGDWRLETSGVWVGEIEVQQRSQDGSTWETVVKVASDKESNYIRTGSQEKDREMRIEVTAWTSATDARAYLENVNSFGNGLIKITAVGSSTSATCDVVETLLSTDATPYWSEGAFSTLRGFPRTVGLFDNRLWYGGTSYQPQVFYGSEIDEYETFPVGTLDTDRLRYKLGGRTQNAIQWILGQQDLFIGTTGEEYRLGTGDSEQTLVPSIVPKRRLQSNRGSERIQAIMAGDVALFVQKGGRRIREYVYDVAQNVYKSPDLTVLSEHMTKGGIVQMAFSQFPYSILWAVTGDGNLISMTYERDQEVAGWTRHVTQGGSFESVAVIPGDGNDEVWTTVKRTIDGSVVRYMERIDPAEWTDSTEYFFVDCGVKYDGSSTSTISGLDHLEGQTVQVLGDGVYFGDYVVASGAVTLESAVTTASVGLKETTRFKPMKFDIDNVVGNSQGQWKKLSKVEVLMQDSLAPDVYDELGSKYVLKFRDMADETSTPIPAFSGVKETTIKGRAKEDPYFILVADQPYPLTVRAVLARYEITERI